MSYGLFSNRSSISRASRSVFIDGNATHDNISHSLNDREIRDFLLGNILSAVLDDDALVTLRYALTGEVIGNIRHLAVINNAADT